LRDVGCALCLVALGVGCLCVFMRMCLGLSAPSCLLCRVLGGLVLHLWGLVVVRFRRGVWVFGVWGGLCGFGCRWVCCFGVCGVVGGWLWGVWVWGWVVVWVVGRRPRLWTAVISERGVFVVVRRTFCGLFGALEGLFALSLGGGACLRGRLSILGALSLKAFTSVLGLLWAGGDA